VLCLKVRSDAAWALEADADLDAILIDHAHCEMKAASNALSLAARHPQSFALVRALTDLAREEIDHFQRVIAFLERRGLRLGPPPVDAYAADLRRAVSELERDPEIPSLVDRLLVAALIEARSCERFKLLLSIVTPERDPELHAFYTELFAAEARHYQALVDLAEAAAGDAAPRVGARLERLAEREAAIVARLARGDARATIHG
jgi:tRNA 2-(methylsulfanyl)-N6-isopentenyladenosine37 hydroxylase